MDFGPSRIELSFGQRIEVRVRRGVSGADERGGVDSAPCSALCRAGADGIEIEGAASSSNTKDFSRPERQRLDFLKTRSSRRIDLAVRL